MVQKPRVYQVAKDFNVSSEALLGILERLGAPAKSHMSTVDPAVVDKVRQMFQEEKAATKAEDARKQEAKAALEREARRPAPAAPAAAAPSAPAAPPPAKPVEPPRPVPEPPAAPPPPAASAAPPPRPAPPRRRRGSTDEKAVRDSVKKTLANLEGGRPKRYRKRVVEPAPQQPGTAVATHEVDEEVIRIPEMTSVAELAEVMQVAPAEVITKLLGMGKMATVNQRLDKETLELVALEFGHTVEFVTDFELEETEEKEEADRPEDLQPRAPVVTVMGHVDHGKTSLLDRVRKANVVAGEKGGITQHIGAYEVRLGDGREVTFLDTPGHEAFTAMRARGAKVTDIVVLVVAADDRVMPQTLEAIDHAKAAEVPIIVAINKVDKPEANLARIKQDLASHNLLIEEFGGTVPSAEISAKTGQGIEDLLELILLQADLLELKANPKRNARGTVVESKVEQGRGKVVTVLVQNGTLKIGDPFVAGKEHGRVRAMSDERGKRVKKAGPSVPVEVLGCEGSPLAGDAFTVSNSESQAREVAQKRQLRAREVEQQQRKVSLLDFHDMMEKGEVQELKLIIKADVAGSVEVLRQQLEAVGTDEVQCRVIRAQVGQITESDVLLAEASNAVIIGFGVKTDPRAQGTAQRNHVDIRHYNIIYEVVEDVKGALSGLLKPEEVEKIQGRAEVRQVFRVSRVGSIAGCYVSDGTIGRTNRARLLRDGEAVFDGKIGSLKRFKDDVREVQQGFECGIGLEGFDQLQEGDVIEAYIVEQQARRI